MSSRGGPRDHRDAGSDVIPLRAEQRPQARSMSAYVPELVTADELYEHDSRSSKSAIERDGECHGYALKHFSPGRDISEHSLSQIGLSFDEWRNSPDPDSFTADCGSCSSKHSPSPRSSRTAPTLHLHRPRSTTKEGPDAKFKSSNVTPVDEAKGGASIRLLFAGGSKQDKLVLGLAILTAMVQGGSVPVANWLLGYTFNIFTVFSTGTKSEESVAAFKHGAGLATLGFVILGIGAALLEWLVVMLWTITAERIVRRTRLRLMQGLKNNSMDWYDQKREGSAGLMSRFSADLEEIKAGCSQNLGHIVQFVTSFASTLLLALVKSWSLTLVILASIPFIIIITVITDMKGRPLMSLERSAHSDAGTALEDSLMGISTVKVFNGSCEELKRFKSHIERARILYSKLQWVWAARQGLCQFILLAMFVQGFWFGTFLVQAGKIDAGSVLTVFWSCVTAATYLQQCMPLTVFLSKAKIAIARLQKDLVPVRLRQDRSRMTGITPQKISRGDFEFQDVVFQYPSRPGRLVLNNVSIFLPGGDTTFLVGASGSGKSTIGQLLLKLYQPSSGRILMDDQNQRYLDDSWVRRQIGYVQQNSVLFEDTIFNNIIMGSGRTDEFLMDDVKRWCKIALIHSFIQDLPLGYETVLHQRSVTLSGGQRQRIALARALFRESTLLILDEATSALDSTTRNLVYQAVRQSRKGKSTLIITHDLSQLQDSDFFYMLKDGLVVEQGYRSDMSEKSQSEFCRLAELQRNFTKAEAQVNASDHDSTRSSHAKRAEPYANSKALTNLQPLYDLRPESVILPIEDAVNLLVPEIQDLEEKGKWAAKRRSGQSRTMPAASQKSEINGNSAKRPRKKLIRLFAKFARDPVLLVSGLLACVLNGAITPIFSFLLSRLLSNLSYSSANGSMEHTSSPQHTAAFWSMLVLAVAAFDGFSAFLRYLLLELASANWIYRVRERAFAIVLQQEQIWFDRRENNLASLATLVMKDSEDMRSIMGQQLGSITTVCVMLAMGIIWALVSGWELTLAGLVLAPCYAGLTIGQNAIARRVESQNKSISDSTAHSLYEVMVGLRTIRCMSLETLFAKKVNDKIDKAYRIASRNAFKMGLGQGLSEFLQYSGRGFMFYIGMLLIVSGQYDLTRMLQVFALITFSIATGSTIISTLPGFSKGRQAADDLSRLLLLPNKSENSGSVQRGIEGHIEFDRVDFTYATKGVKVIKQLSLSISAGERIALVGKSGSGKSTVAALLQRLYRIDSGLILLDGSSIEHWEAANLRCQIGIATQNAALFDLTIAENIMYGLDSSALSALASLEQYCTNADHCEEGGLIYEAAKRARILPWILSLPNQFRTNLGQDILGKMSGGQAQRMQLARLFIRLPFVKILILDECTSALDVDNSSAILDEIFDSDLRPTTLIITHKVDAMKRADRIAVLDGGTVVEEGTFEDLIRSEGHLQRLLSGEQDDSGQLM